MSHIKVREPLFLYSTVLQIPGSGLSWANGSKDLLKNVQVMVLPSGNRTQAQDRKESPSACARGLSCGLKSKSWESQTWTF